MTCLLRKSTPKYWHRVLNKTILTHLPEMEAPESPCTRNGCADSIPIASRVYVECSTPVGEYVKHLTPLSENTNRPNAASDPNVTNDSNGNVDSSIINSSYVTRI